MNLGNSNGIESRKFYFTTYRSFFRKFSSEGGKCIMWSSIQVLPNQVNKKTLLYVEDVDLRESHAKLHKKLSETFGVD